MEHLILYLLIVIAIALGWLLGRRDRVKHSEMVGPNYYQGLNYLLNEDSDSAVTTFVESLEVNKETLETHLALGGLLRRRGELDSAVLVHENILSRAQLDKSDMQEVQLELAKDYLLAGLLDRAEELCVKLIQEHKIGESDSIRRESLKIILEIYEREKEWSQATEVAKLLAVGDDEAHYEKAISHYYCEIAEELLSENKLAVARDSLREAIGHGVNNPRTSLIRGKIDVKEELYSEAITALTKIRDQDAAYVPESLGSLEEAYRLARRPQEELRNYLEACLVLTPSISIVTVLAKSIRAELGDQAVAKFISSYLKKNPTIRGLSQLIDLHIDQTDGMAKENLAILKSFAEALVANKPAYRCNGCGFEGKRMHWRCPVCKDWATIAPIFGLEGE